MRVSTHPPRAGLAAPAFFLLAALGPLHAQELSVSLQEVVSELDQPIGIENRGSPGLFIIEQAGVVELLLAGSLQSPPFLDVSSRVTTSGNEQGLLGLAFHPDYATNGVFFIYYTEDTAGDSVIERCTELSGGPNQGDCSAEDIIFTLPQPAANHNGGKIAFGPDGYLYVALGDGGGGGDPNENAQDITDLHGKILRLDVDGDDFTGDPDRDYAIPPDNPFVGKAGADEIWAFGLRNPWRFSFDRLSGDLWIGDVGQQDWEEINYEPAGGPGGRNYGWDVLEGFHCFEDMPSGSCNDFLNGGSTLPVVEIDSSGTGNCSVTGGFRYRGVADPELLGYYVYGDFCSGRIWALRPDCSGGWVNQEVAHTTNQITSFGEDAAGELYLVDRANGTLYLLEAQPAVARLLAPSIDVIQFGEHSVNDVDFREVFFEYAGAGPDNLQIDAFDLSDTDHFFVDVNGGSDPCGATPVSLGPAQDCTANVYFLPGRQGDFDENLCVSGNMPAVSISLRATVSCSGADDDSVANVTVTDDSFFSACLTLTGGPNVTVQAANLAEFRAGQSIAIDGEFTVQQGATLSLVIDPVLARP